MKDLSSKFVHLPPLPKNIKKTAIFDLDETLAHCVDDVSVDKY